MPKIAGNRAFTLVEIMIVVGVIALLSAIAVPNLIAARRTANEAAAKANVRSLSSAAETASVSLGGYPVTLAVFQNFIGAAVDYCADLAGGQTELQGYNFSCTMDITGYTFVASPAIPGTSGNITYTATTGGIITPL